MKPTPGPWQQSYFVDQNKYAHMDNKWKEDWQKQEQLIVRGPGIIGSPECNVVAMARTPEDAKLIAAAPDLLSALQGILDIGKRDTTNPKYDDYYAAAKYAIKKAVE